MANIFCPTCGAKSIYNISPPNFCGKCGLPYVQTSQTSARLSQSKLASRKVAQQQQEDDDFFDENDDNSDGSIGGSYYSDSNRVPRISKLLVETDSSTDVRVFKFSDLLSEKNIDNGEFN